MLMYLVITQYIHSLIHLCIDTYINTDYLGFFVSLPKNVNIVFTQVKRNRRFVKYKL